MTANVAAYSFVLQLISLAGLHSTAAVTAELSREFKEDGMLAYVKLIQRREKELGVDVLTHQKWSGAAYVDGILGAIQSGSSGSKGMGEGNTETGIPCSYEHIVLQCLTSLCLQVSRCEGNDILDVGTTNQIAGIPRY